MSSGEFRGLPALLQEATLAAAEQPPFLALKRRTGFIFDNHGDEESLDAAIDYCLRHDLDIGIGGDMINKIYSRGGAFNGIVKLAHAKIERPYNVHLIAGDHEKVELYGDGEHLMSIGGWMNEMIGCKVVQHDPLFGNFFAAWSNGAYTADVLVVHAGLPAVQGAEEFFTIPKSESVYADRRLTQLLLNDHWVPHMASDAPDAIGVTREDVDSLITIPNTYRDARPDVEDEERPFVYGDAHFERVMGLLQKKVLVRGHNHHANGISGNIVTLHTNQKFGQYGLPIDQGGIRGVYIAVIDPDKKVTSAVDVELVKLK